MDISPDEIETNRKAEIVMFYHALCGEIIPRLKMMLIAGLPGNPINVFERDFKKNFYALFLLTCDKKELNKAVVLPTKEWLNTKHIPYYKDMIKGLELFDSYKAELFRVNVL